MSIVTGTVSNGITLGQAGFTSPLLVTHTGAVSNSTGVAVYASGTYRDPVVLNQGTILDTGAFAAVGLNDGGIVANLGNSALIQGYTGIYISGAAGVVTNSGTIAGTGTHGGGVILSAGGAVVNSGLITGGITISHAAGTVANSGTIVVAKSAFVTMGINLTSGGSVGNTGLIEGGYGIRAGSDAKVTNSGTIIGTEGGLGGVVLEHFILPNNGVSSVANTGLIQGQNAGGVYISYFGDAVVGAVTNSGTIEGKGSVVSGNQQRHNGGVFLGAGGRVRNTGLIHGVSGVYVGKAAGTVTNSGVITGTGLPGVILAAGGTVVDSGKITGGNGTAVSFGGSGGNLLTLEHGYHLVGAVTVAGTANTLELLGAAGAVTVDFDKPGAGFGNFGTVAFAVSGNHTETLAITDDTTLPGIISGFTQRHDIVDLTQLAPKHATATLNAGDRLVVGNGSQSVSLQLDPSENYSGVVWQARPDGSGGTDVTVIHSGDAAPPAASTAGFAFAAPTAAATGSPPAPQYKNGASLSQIVGGSTPIEHFLLASGHGPPFG